MLIIFFFKLKNQPEMVLKQNTLPWYMITNSINKYQPKRIQRDKLVPKYSKDEKKEGRLFQNTS